jgi:peptidoglycan/xylan/chitin deacetylase (PgdA/CDA1 family)
VAQDRKISRPQRKGGTFEQKGLVVKSIMYHYVREDVPTLPYFRHLHIEDFRRQLDHFAATYRFCSAEEFYQALETGVPVANTVVLTFDDGFKDHYQFVFPELRRRGIVGIFYIPTYPYRSGKLLDVHRTHMLVGRFGGQRIWEELSGLISPEMLSHEHVREFQEETYRTQTNDGYTNRVKRTLNYYIDYAHRERVIDALMLRFFPDEGTLAHEFYATPAEIAEMSEAGMIIGSHTVNHPCMSKLPPDRQRLEIVESFEFLEGITGRPKARTFCYPYGGFHSFTDDTERILDELGCAFSFNVERRDIEPRDLRHRRQALPRYDCNLFPFGTSREFQPEVRPAKD